MDSGSSNMTAQNYDPALIILRRENVDLKYVLTFNHRVLCIPIAQQKLNSCPQAYELVHPYPSSDWRSQASRLPLLSILSAEKLAVQKKRAFICSIC